MTTYNVRVYRGASGPYVDLRVTSDMLVNPGDQVALTFQDGDINRPQLLGKFSGSTVDVIDSRGVQFKNVPCIENINLTPADKALLVFLDGDNNKPVAVQNVDTTTVKQVLDARSVMYTVYPPKSGMPPGTGVAIIFPGGDRSQGIMVYTGAGVVSAADLPAMITVGIITTVVTGKEPIEEISDEATGYGISYKRNSCFVFGMFWSFYINEDSPRQFGYTTVTDAGVVSDFTVIRQVDYALWVDTYFDGTYIHYAVQQTTHTPILYRKGQLNSDGTITWLAPEQTAKSGTGIGYGINLCSITVNSIGNVFISYIICDNGTEPRFWGQAAVTWNTSRWDGIWATDGDEILDGLDALGYGQDWMIILRPLATGKILAFFGGANVVPTWWRWIVKIWSGTNWGSPIDTSSMFLQYMNKRIDIDTRGDNIYLIYGCLETYTPMTDRVGAMYSLNAGASWTSLGIIATVDWADRDHFAMQVGVTASDTFSGEKVLFFWTWANFYATTAVKCKYMLYTNGMLGGVQEITKYLTTHPGNLYSFKISRTNEGHTAITYKTPDTVVYPIIGVIVNPICWILARW